MGEVTTQRLDNLVKTEGYFSGNIFNGDSSCVNSRQEMILKINLSDLFFNGFHFPMEGDRNNDKVFSGGIAPLISGLRRVGWDDNIIYDSIMESRDVFLEKEGIRGGYKEVFMKHKCLELYDVVKNGLEAYLKVGR